MKRCSRCVLPDTMPNIRFDTNNVCNFCHSHKKFEFKGEAALLKVLDTIRNTGEEYDCICSISGGRDSTFTLLKFVKDYKMRVLAVNYQNPFTDPQASKNIQNAVELLGVDLISFKLRENIHEKTFKHNLLAWMKHPDPSMVPILCIACKTYYLNILRIAREYGIQCIVSGGDPYEDTGFKKELLNISSDEKIENSFMKSIRGVVLKTIQNPRYLHPVCLPTMIKGYFFGDPYTIGSRIYGRNITRIDLFHFIDWDEKEIISRIQSELKWDYPHQFASTWRFDCQIGHLKDYLYMKTLHMTEKDDHYAKMVRQGLISREDAIKRLEKENQIYCDEIESLMKKVGITDLSFLQEI